MAGISFDKSSLGVDTNRVAASSRAFVKKTVSDAGDRPATQTALSYAREMPDTSDAPFVEVGGRRLYLNVPRGTYLNILV